MIDKDKPRLLRVRRPDGAIVPMTITLALFEEVWEPKGYSMKSDLSQFEEPEEVETVAQPLDDQPEKPAQSKRRGRARGNRTDIPAEPVED